MKHLPKACFHPSCLDGSVIKHRKDLYRFWINPSNTFGAHLAFLAGSGLPVRGPHAPLRQTLPVATMDLSTHLRLPRHTPSALHGDSLTHES